MAHKILKFTMTTPLFFDTSRASKLESLLEQVSGESVGKREIIHNETISAVVAGTSPKFWNPAEHAEVKSAKKNRSLIIWADKPKYAFVPGPKCFGRIVTLHSCFVPPGHEDPTSEAEFRQLPGYEVCVFGGVGDPQFNRGWRDLPFSTSRHRVIFSNTIQVASPMKLAWWVESSDVGDKKGDGAFFFLRVDGLVEVFGQYM
jgi:hypothetical protein